MTKSEIHPVAAATGVLQAFRWPVAFVLFCFIFYSPLSRLIAAIQEGVVSKNDKGWEIRFKVAASLADASISSPADSESKRQPAPHGRTADVVAKSTSPDVLGILSRSKVLWVDDNPTNNQAERAALEQLGVKVAISTTTDDALRRLRAESFNAVISDMKRGDRETAGYDLLDSLKQFQPPPPVVFYSASSNPQFRQEARARGAFDETNQPTELLALVVAAIQRRPKS